MSVKHSLFVDDCFVKKSVRKLKSPPSPFFLKFNLIFVFVFLVFEHFLMRYSIIIVISSHDDYFSPGADLESAANVHKLTCSCPQVGGGHRSTDTPPPSTTRTRTDISIDTNVPTISSHLLLHFLFPAATAVVAVNYHCG